MPTDKNIPALLAQRFMHEYTEAIKNYALDQKIELLEHLHNGLKCFEQYVKTKKSSCWDDYLKNEKTLLKKYGSHFLDYSNRQLNKFFDPEMAILSSWIFDSKEFNSLTAEEQVLSDKQCNSFIWHSNNALTHDIKFLYLQRSPEIDGLGKSKKSKDELKPLPDIEQDVQEIPAQNKKNVKPSSDDEYMNISELAKFLKCSTVTVHKYKKEGLPFFRVGRKILFKKSEVLDFMKKSKYKRVIGK